MPVRKPKTVEKKVEVIETIDEVIEVVEVEPVSAGDGLPRQITLPDGLVVSRKYYEANKHKFGE